MRHENHTNMHVFQKKKTNDNLLSFQEQKQKKLKKVIDNRTFWKFKTSANI